MILYFIYNIPFFHIKCAQLIIISHKFVQWGSGRVVATLFVVINSRK